MMISPFKDLTQLIYHSKDIGYRGLREATFLSTFIDTLFRGMGPVSSGTSTNCQ
jgi:hypothetical protein